ncbi:MAG: hypothetical protein ACRYFZ_18155 [Janthinobacterium lividum]
MQATLHLPSALPRPLTAPELASLEVHHGPQFLQITDGEPALRQLLGAAHDTIGSGVQLLIVGVEHAADLDLPVNVSATSAVSKLLGIGFEDEPLVGPVLIIEA